MVKYIVVVLLMLSGGGAYAAGNSEETKCSNGKGNTRPFNLGDDYKCGTFEFVSAGREKSYGWSGLSSSDWSSWIVPAVIFIAAIFVVNKNSGDKSTPNDPNDRRGGVY